MPPLPSDVDGNGKHIGKIHRGGICDFTELERSARSNRGDDAIDLFVCLHVILSNKGANLLSRVVILFVYARRKQVAAQHDAAAGFRPEARRTGKPHTDAPGL